MVSLMYLPHSQCQLTQNISSGDKSNLLYPPQQCLWSAQLVCLHAGKEPFIDHHPEVTALLEGHWQGKYWLDWLACLYRGTLVLA
jgi:hypothetical protein